MNIRYLKESNVFLFIQASYNHAAMLTCLGLCNALQKTRQVENECITMTLFRV